MSEPKERTDGEEVIPKVDVAERGAKHADGTPQLLNRRLFVQLLVFDCSLGKNPEIAAKELADALTNQRARGVVYRDVNAPRGLGVLTYSDEPEHFVTRTRPAITSVDGLVQRMDHNMLGRSYSLGYEQDLSFWLVERPMSVMENAEWPWAVWYPLRRSGAFAKLGPREQAGILREHAIIGRAYGQQDLAHDVRLACHGLDGSDNEFVVGLIGKDLHPLSHVVQAMRKTRQTAEFIAQMGPFFVGHVAARTGAPRP